MLFLLTQDELPRLSPPFPHRKDGRKGLNCKALVSVRPEGMDSTMNHTQPNESTAIRIRHRPYLHRRS